MVEVVVGADKRCVPLLYILLECPHVPFEAVIEIWKQREKQKKLMKKIITNISAAERPSFGSIDHRLNPSTFWF